MISAYKLPDHSELNYHTGTATRSNCGYLDALHLYLGVQCCGDDDNAEIVAGILLCACKYLDKHLDKVRVNLNNNLVELHDVLKGNFQLIDAVITFSNSDFCKAQVDRVRLYCYCHTPWIEGTTSYAIYGDKQKEYNVYNCNGCDNWFQPSSMSYSYSKA